MPDLGIGEAIAAILSSGLGAAAEGAGAAGAAEAGALGAGEGLAAGGAAAGAGAAPAIAGLEGLAPFGAAGGLLPETALGFAPTEASALGTGVGTAGEVAAPVSAGLSSPVGGAAGGAAAFAPPGAGALDAATGPIGDFWASVNPATQGGLSGITPTATGPLDYAGSPLAGATGTPPPAGPGADFAARFGAAGPGLPSGDLVTSGVSSPSVVPTGTPQFTPPPLGDVTAGPASFQPAGAAPSAPVAPGGAAAGAEIGPSAGAAGPSTNASALSAGLDQQMIDATAGAGAPTNLAAPAAGGATPAAAASGGGGFADYIKKNPGLLAALGLGGAALAMGANQKVPQQGNLQQLVGQEQTFQQQQQGLAQSLTQPLLTGKLPADQQATVDRALSDAIATTKARYAQMGLADSSALSDQIAYLTQQSRTIAADLETKMAATGTAAAGTAATAFGLQNSVFQSLMNAQIQQDTALRNSIAQFAGAAAIGSGLSAKA